MFLFTVCCLLFLVTCVSSALFPSRVPVLLPSLIVAPHTSHISLVSTTLFLLSIDLQLIPSLDQFVCRSVLLPHVHPESPVFVFLPVFPVLLCTFCVFVFCKPLVI